MSSPISKNGLKVSIFLVIFVIVAEALGGIYSNSLALLSDAAHSFLDGFALALTWFALVISKRSPTPTKTFGYHRFETLAAFFNGLLLLGMASTILLESNKRLWNPKEIHSAIVIWVATFGLVLNLVIFYFLRKSFKGKQDINIKSAFYHVLGDLFASIGIILGAIVVYFTDWYRIDATIGLGIGFLILWGSYKILSESIYILLESVPRDISIEQVKNAIKAIPKVINLHELHIWYICSNIYALSTHVLIQEINNDKRQLLLEEIGTILKDKFNITHSTIQLEHISCTEPRSFCGTKS